MSNFSVDKALIVAFMVYASGVLEMNASPRIQEKKEFVVITKETYKRHYPSFKKYFFDRRLGVNTLSKMPLWLMKQTVRVWEGKKYDPFTISCIPASYSLFNRNPKDSEFILESIGSDQYIDHLNHLLKRCTEKSGDLNWVARVTYEEGENLRSKIKRETGKEPSERDRDTFVAVGVFAQYWVENKHQ